MTDTGRVPAPESVAPPREFDPPVRFDTANSVPLPAEAGQGRINLGGRVSGPLPVTLYRTTAYIAAVDNLQVVDTRTGRVTATIRPHRGTVDTDSYGGGKTVQPPALTDVDGKSIVVVPFVVRIAGSGTTPSHRGVEVVSIDTSTGREVANALVDLESWADEPWVRVVAATVGTHGPTAVLRVSGSRLSSKTDAYAVDLSDGRTVWGQSGFTASAVIDSVTVGAQAQDAGGISLKVTGVAVDDGRVLWTMPTTYSSASAAAAGPSIAAVIATDYSSGRQSLSLVDAVTGAVRQTDTNGYTSVDCYYDGASITVCTGNEFSDPWAAAFDTTSLKWLWSLPDSETNRVSPDVTAIWHGAVYGTTENGPVVLDARTGSDRSTDSGAAPYVVNGSVGIGIGPTDSEVRAYPASG